MRGAEGRRGRRSLAIVQSVVRDHHGQVSVESERGKGATLRIELGGAA